MPASGTRSTGGRCESCSTSSNASDDDSVSDAPLIKNMNQLKLKTNMQDLQVTTGYASVLIPMWSTLISSVNEARDIELPVMDNCDPGQKCICLRDCGVSEENCACGSSLTRPLAIP